MHSTDNKNQLPDTGENRQANEGTLVGSLLAIVGSLFIFGRRKKVTKIISYKTFCHCLLVNGGFIMIISIEVIVLKHFEG